MSVSSAVLKTAVSACSTISAKYITGCSQPTRIIAPRGTTPRFCETPTTVPSSRDGETMSTPRCV